MTEKNRRLLLAIIFLSVSTFLYIWFGNILLALIVSASGLIFIADLFSGLENRRLILLHGQLIELINHIIIMLKAGRTIRFIFENAENKFPRPLNLYLTSMSSELKLGNSLSRSLDIFKFESRSNEVGLLAAAIKINQETGGDIIHVLNSITESLINGLRSKSRARTLSLQGRFSANIIALFPVVVLVLLNMFIGGRIADFFSSRPGLWMLISGGILQVAGIIIIKQIFRNIV
ncbi:MAG: type II secretion system F family protein [Actinobacteria bacterium]|nr:type II secretion system F family protein [Actinomycetota bacterium]